MIKQNLVLDISAVGILVAALHARAIAEVWYWNYWWMDILMHFLAGLFVGLIVLFVISHVAGIKKVSSRTLLITLGVVLLVGIGWEVFEYATGVFVIEDPFPDTLYDLVMDTLGGVAAYIYATSSRRYV